MTTAPLDAAADTDLAIEVRDLTRTYGSGAEAFDAVRGVDLAVARGTIHALLGVNGAGKTSTLEVVEGLAPASAGEVRVLGLDPVRRPGGRTPPHRRAAPAQRLRRRPDRAPRRCGCGRPR